VCNAKAYPGANTDSHHNPVVAKLRAKLKEVLQATVRQWWNLERMKDDGTALDYRSNIDTAAVAEKQECADLNGRWEHFKSAVVKVAEQTLGHKTREEVRKDGGLTSPSTLQIILETSLSSQLLAPVVTMALEQPGDSIHRKKNKITKDNQNVPSGKTKTHSKANWDKTGWTQCRLVAF